MDLQTAVRLVYADVADNVYQRPTLALALRYARTLITSAELANVLENQTTHGCYADDDNFLVDGTRDVHGAYLAVRAATDDELTPVVAAINAAFDYDTDADADVTDLTD